MASATRWTSSNVFEARRAQTEDVDVSATSQPRHRSAHVVQRDRADLTQILSHDQIRSERCERVFVDIVDAERFRERCTNRRIDRTARSRRGDARSGEHAASPDRFWEITLVRYSDELRLTLQRADDFGGRRQQGNDSQV
jgi:hypothetical protein